MLIYLSFSFKIFHSVETAAVFHLAYDHPNVLLERGILLGILFAMRYPICAEFEFHVVGEQCSAHVGHSSIRQVSYFVIIQSYVALWKWIWMCDCWILFRSTQKNKSGWKFERIDCCHGRRLAQLSPRISVGLQGGWIGTSFQHHNFLDSVVRKNWMGIRSQRTISWSCAKNHWKMR